MGCGFGLGILTAPHQGFGPKGLAHPAHLLADAAIAQHAQGFATELTPQMALPQTVFEPLNLRGEVAHAGQHQQKRHLGGRRAGTAPFTHRDATRLASGEIQVSADLAGL